MDRLAERVTRGERLQIRKLLTRVSGVKLEPKRILDRAHPELLPTQSRGQRERRLAETGERRSPPEPESVAEPTERNSG